MHILNREQVEEMVKAGPPNTALPILGTKLLEAQNESSAMVFVFTDPITGTDLIAMAVGATISVWKGSELLATHVFEGFAGPVGSLISHFLHAIVTAGAVRVTEASLLGPYLGYGRRGFMKEVRQARREAKGQVKEAKASEKKTASA